MACALLGHHKVQSPVLPPLPTEGLPEGLPCLPHPFSLPSLPLSLASSPPVIKCSLRAPLLSLPVGTAFITVRIKQLFLMAEAQCQVFHV